MIMLMNRSMLPWIQLHSSHLYSDYKPFFKRCNSGWWQHKNSQTDRVTQFTKTFFYCKNLFNIEIPLWWCSLHRLLLKHTHKHLFSGGKNPLACPYCNTTQCCCLIALVYWPPSQIFYDFGSLYLTQTLSSLPNFKIHKCHGHLFSSVAYTPVGDNASRAAVTPAVNCL